MYSCTCIQAYLAFVYFWYIYISVLCVCVCARLYIYLCCVCVCPWKPRSCFTSHVLIYACMCLHGHYPSYIYIYIWRSTSAICPQSYIAMYMNSLLCSGFLFACTCICAYLISYAYIYVDISMFPFTVIALGLICVYVSVINALIAVWMCTYTKEVVVIGHACIYKCDHCHPCLWL